MAYEPPESLWRLVERIISIEEREEIRAILGDSLVDQSLDLHVEANSLLEIWQSFKSETDTMTTSRPKRLPEPPGMRDTLRNHIRMLVENIRENSRNDDRDSEVILSRNKGHIIDYVMDDGSRGSSVSCVQSRTLSSISSRSGRETPMRMSPPSSEEDRLSGSISASQRVDSVRDRLNVQKIDEVVQELRSTLQDEVAQLLSDIKFLQNCLENENDFRCETEMSVYDEPSIQELIEERSKLERTSSLVPDIVDVINNVRRRSMPGSPKRVVKPLSSVSPISPSSPQGLRPSPPSSAGKSQARSRTLPLKARHPLRKTSPVRSGLIADNGSGVIANKATTDGRGTNLNSPTSPSPIQPSPPTSAKRPKGSPTPSTRFCQRFRDVHRQNSSS